MLVAVLLVPVPQSVFAAEVANPSCAVETVFYDPGNGQDIVVPSGYTVSVFARNLDFPTAVAFVGGRHNFEVYALESGHGLPSRCNRETNPIVGGEFWPPNLLGYRGLIAGDIDMLQKAARASGMATAVDPGLENKLPQHFRQLGMRTHNRFDELADATKTGAARDAGLKRLAAIMASCVTCPRQVSAGRDARIAVRPEHVRTRNASQHTEECIRGRAVRPG